MTTSPEQFIARLKKELGQPKLNRDWLMFHCPAHDDRKPSLSVRILNGRLAFKCFAGCPNENVVTALKRLGLDPTPLLMAGTKTATAQRSGLSVEHYAKEKALPVEFLEANGVGDYTRSRYPAVRMEYRDAGGKVVAVRLRFSMHGDDRFRWCKGDKP